MPSARFALISFVFFLSITACTEPEEQAGLHQPKIIGITVADMERSMNWYTSHLYFIRDTVMSFPDYGITVGMMHQGDFYLELVTFENSFPQSAINLPEGSSAINGFFKIGFQVKDLEKLYTKLSSAKEVTVIAEIGDLLTPKPNYPWPEKYFLVEDPDGNYIQFFSSLVDRTSREELTPFLIAQSSADIDASIHWYEQQLGAELINKVGSAGNERAILDRDGFVLELGEFEGYIPFDSLSIAKETGLSQIHGIRKLSFLVNNIEDIYKKYQAAGIPFDFDLTEQKSMVADRYFMITDNAGNSIQYLEKDR